MGTRDDARVLKELEREGLMPFTDTKLPSIAAVVAGEPIRGSWWSHEKARVIYAVCESLTDHPDLLIAPMLSGKLTWIHRSLWPEVLAVATERAPWQLAGLTAPARSVLGRISRVDSVRTDSLPKPEAAASRVLEKRLLVHAGQVHTEKGSHARLLEGWENWAHEARFDQKLPDPAAARAALEERVEDLNARYSTSARLPWETGRRR